MHKATLPTTTHTTPLVCIKDVRALQHITLHWSQWNNGVGGIRTEFRKIRSPEICIPIATFPYHHGEGRYTFLLQGLPS